MKRVITYGTFDLFHEGHLRLLERAKKLGDYLIVGVTTDNYDVTRGKLNVRQSAVERVQAVKDTGLADEIILEDYEGQKIDDVQRYNIDVFVIGSDWTGQFDYLNEYCDVVYLERTKGISSTLLRENGQFIRMGILGTGEMVRKFVNEARYVSGVGIQGICIENEQYDSDFVFDYQKYTNYDEMLGQVDAVYILSSPRKRAQRVREALQCGCHVMCESPIALNREDVRELYECADQNEKILFEALKTGYYRAFGRLVTLIKSGAIGIVKAIDVSCTSMKPANEWTYNKKESGGSMTDWGPFAMLPMFKILGCNYKKSMFVSHFDEENGTDSFTDFMLLYDNAIAHGKVGYGVKTEGNLVISGTKAYIYVPSPWWKLEYFEIRYEDFNNNRRHFYKIEGEGIRYELAEFLKIIRTGEKNTYIDKCLSESISGIMEVYFGGDVERI